MAHVLSDRFGEINCDEQKQSDAYGKGKRVGIGSDQEEQKEPKAIMIRTDLMAINGALERTLLWSFSRSQRFVPG